MDTPEPEPEPNPEEKAAWGKHPNTLKNLAMGIGRKPMPPKKRRTVTVGMLKANEEDNALIRSFLAEYGLTFGGLVRTLIFDEMKRRGFIQKNS